MNPSEVERRERVRSGLRGLGFSTVRFARAEPADHGLAAWLAAGYHAGMGWMATSAAKRTAPGQVLAGARTVVVLGVNYGAAAAQPGAGEVWARYALHTDYHDTIGAALRRAEALLAQECGVGAGAVRGFVDGGPVMERAWAVEAGAGLAGKNGNLLSREFGNWLLLAVLLTEVALPPDDPLAGVGAGEGGASAPGCGKCTLCMDACPTAAFPAPGVVDARRCLSYHTIENRGPLPRDLRPRLGARLFGCDRCLEVCPWNRFAQAAHCELLARRDDLGRLRLLEVLRLTPEGFRERFAGTAIRRTKHAGLLRNACVVAGNVWRGGGVEPGTTFPAGFAEAGEAEAAAGELQRLAATSVPLVRAHAVWALGRIGAASGAGWEGLRRAENDADVLAEYAAAASVGDQIAGEAANSSFMRAAKAGGGFTGSP